MVEPILPTADEVLRPGVEALVAARPNALKYINTGTGRWSHLVAAWRAQAELSLARLAQLVASCRLNLATGDELKELIASEYAPLPNLQPTAAVGSVTITRTGTLPQGIIKTGTVFNRQTVSVSTPTSPSLPAAKYKTSQDVFVPQGIATVTLPLVADQVGSKANQPLFTGLPTNIQISDKLFDPLFTASSYSMAGGSDGFSDSDLRVYARSYVSGKFAPNDKALIAGAFGSSGVKHAAIVDQGTGTATVWVADSAWASSDQWNRSVKQSLNTNKWVGNGCSVDVQGVTNIPVGVTCTVRLSDANAIFETSAINAAIIAAVQNYFDSRPDFYTWRLASLRAVVARAHEKILSCPTLVVVDSSGVPLAEPSTTPTTIYHYRMDSSLKATFQYPT